MAVLKETSLGLKRRQVLNSNCSPGRRSPFVGIPLNGLITYGAQSLAVCEELKVRTVHRVWLHVRN